MRRHRCKKSSESNEYQSNIFFHLAEMDKSVEKLQISPSHRDELFSPNSSRSYSRTPSRSSLRLPKPTVELLDENPLNY